MNRFNLLIYILAICIVSACSKENVKPLLPKGSISILNYTDKDSLERAVSVAKDTSLVIGLKAVLTGQVSSEEHIIKFRPDSTRVSAYRAKYGDAKLLPAESYFFFRSQCRIPAGASFSDSIQFNIVSQTKLRPLTTYVLPIVIQSIDGETSSVDPKQVLYLVAKTGKSPGFSKSDWKIVSVTSEQGTTGPAKNVLDRDLNTTWVSGYTAMPQGMVIDFADELTFSGVSYGLPAEYFPYGAYAKRIKIEMSTDGTNWIDKGTYNGVTVPTTGTINLGVTTARYMRFTVLEAAPYIYPFIELVWVGDISLIP